MTRKVFWAIRAFKVPLLYPAEPPFLVLPSVSRASLTSFGTASLRRPLGLRLGATKKRARDDSPHRVIPQHAPFFVIPRHASAEGPLAYARGDREGSSGRHKIARGNKKWHGATRKSLWVSNRSPLQNHAEPIDRLLNTF